MVWWFGILYWHTWCTVAADSLVVWYFVLARLVHWWLLMGWYFVLARWCTVAADVLVFCTGTPGAQWLLMFWYFVLARLVHSGC